MRRIVGIVLLTLGIFSLSLAPLLLFYAAPKLIVAPVDEVKKLTLTSPNGQYFSASEMKLLNAPLINTVTLIGQKESTDSTAVWAYFSSLEDASRHTDVTSTDWRLAFDRKTGELKNCCTASVDKNTGTQQQGIGLLFPFDTKKKTYQRFDPSTARSWPAVYQGEETVNGLKTYKFTERIEKSLVSLELSLPGVVFGLPEGNYSAQKMYSADLTLWVDPVTGVVVDQRQQVNGTLRTTDGKAEIPILIADVRMTEESRKDQVKTAKEAGDSIQLLRVTGPIGALVAGGVLLAAGWIVLRQRGRHRNDGAAIESSVSEPA